MATPLKKFCGWSEKNCDPVVGWSKFFAILWVGGAVRHPHIKAYGGNSADGWFEKFGHSVGRWFEKNCDSAGGWSDNSNVVTLPINFLME